MFASIHSTRRVLVRVGALGDEVVHVVRPVLDRRVADLGLRQRDDFHDGRVERIGGVDRRRAALDVVDLRAFLDHDQRPLELAGVLAVDPEVGLERQRDLDALGDVHERAARPDRAVERRELVVLGRDDRAEVAAEDVGVFLERLVGAHEHDADLGQLLADRVVDDLGVVLRADAGQELALRLGDPQPLERLLDLLGDVVPRLLFALGRLAVVDDLVEVDVLEVAAPLGHRPAQEVLVRAQPELEHPVGLVLERADLFDGVPGEAALRLAEVDDVVVERELIASVANGFTGLGRRGGQWISRAVLGPLVIPSQIIGINRAIVNATIGGTVPVGVAGPARRLGRQSGVLERPEIATMIAVSTSPTVKPSRR